MSSPVHPLSLQELLQLIRYELRFSRDAMADECGLCPCCYGDIERIGSEINDDVVATIHEQLPRLSTLLRQRHQEAGGADFADRLADLEGKSPAERAVELQRVRLELQWLDGQPAKE
jgi:hypothetical protein